MFDKRFRLSARISSDNPSAIKPILQQLIGIMGTVKSVEDGFEVEADLEGESARALNRMLLSEMRKVERRTRIRSEWASGNVVEKFFDYVPKGTRRLTRGRSNS
jgi:acylphosphatase